MTNTERYLNGQHAVVTGGSRGIGAAVAAALARRGARLTIISRSGTSLEAHAAALRGQYSADVRAVAADVTNATAVEAAFRAATSALGPVNILVNNAGAAAGAKFVGMTRSLWDEMIAVNLTATFSCTMQVIPAMLEAKSGRVINMASTAGLRGVKAMTAYCAAKHGVVGFTRSLALEMAKHGVTVNAVCPGYVDSEMTDRGVAALVQALHKSPEEARAMMVGTIPRGRLTTADEVAGAVAWLCAPEAAAVTGITLPVSGGEGS